MFIKQRSTPVITCYFCGKSGHLQRNCPEKRLQFGGNREVDRNTDRANARNQPEKNVYYAPSPSDKLETVPMNQDHSFKASCSEDADLLLLWEKLKLNESNLNEGEKKQCMKLLKSTKRPFHCQKRIWVEPK